MARSETTWKPGQSGNPRGVAGSPPPQRPLASALALAGNVPDSDGITPTQKVSALIWQFMTAGQVVFDLGGGVTRTLTARTIQEWVDGMKFVYRHLDGDAPKHLSVETPDLNMTGFVYDQLSGAEKAALRDALKAAASTAFNPEEIEEAEG